jgi:hypothetical protein
LHRWLRSATGQWTTVCTIVIACAGGGTYRAVDQLVSAEALPSNAALAALAPWLDVRPLGLMYTENDSAAATLQM